MSKGGWARLRKQQQQSTQIQSGDDDDCQVQCKCSHHQLIAAHPHAHMHHNTTLATTISPASSPSPASSLAAFSPPLRDPISPLNQGSIRTSKLLQIVRRWKALSAKQIASRSHRSTMSSTSCSRLNLVPLSCISFSSFQSYSDHEEEDQDDDVGNDTDITSDSSLKSTKSPASPPLHYKSRSAQAAKPQSSCRPSMKSTRCTGKDNHSSCEREIRAPARRALSFPKLRSPLSSCTASPISMYGDAQEEEELESLQPKKEEADSGSMKLRRSSSSPLRRRTVSKKPSTPKGYLALYVGEERKRFVVKANSVNHPLFSVLLEKAKEEFGFDQKGPLNIPCDIAFFQHIMFLVESKFPL